MRTRTLLTIAIATALAGCQSKPAAQTGAAAASAPSQPAKAAEPAAGEHGCGCGAEMAQFGEHDCKAGASTANASDKVTEKKDPATGATVLAAGSPLAGAAVVKVADLVARPADFAGKTVRVEGDVSAMCTHERAWFAVQDAGDRSGQPVRIITAPGFLVPEGSIGKKARTEGVVELTEVDPATAEHLAADHQVRSASAKAVIIRATGAEFM